MENELNRSNRILEQSVGPRDSKLFKKGLFKDEKTKNPFTGNLSYTLTTDELNYLNEGHSTYVNLPTFLDTTLARSSVQNITTTGSVLEAIQPWDNAVSSLYTEFLEIMQTHSNSQAALDMVCDLSRCCSDTLSVVRTLKSKVALQQTAAEEAWLQDEQNTWRLLFILYQDRLTIQSVKEENQLEQYYGLSEKLCMANLFKRDSLVRETQLVIDWLESIAAENYDALSFTDNMIGWENTLHQLMSPDTIVFKSTREIVTELHPDAPSQQKKSLHDLDVEDEKRLCRLVFTGIRCGKLGEAQKLCIQCGHSWRAAMLNGWKLHHDPAKVEKDNETIDRQEEMDVEKVDSGTIEGNENRDLWKRMALKYCDQRQENNYEKAAIAAYCGYLKHLLAVCNDWNDYLWAYLKVMIDIRVESEIRDCVQRKYQELTDFYWNQRTSLNEIFATLDTSNNETVRKEALKPERVIQKHLILDEISELFKSLQMYTENSEVSTQFLRFAAHLTLFLDQIGKIQKRDVMDSVLERYVKRLMIMEDTQLVAFYVSKITSSDKQTAVYASYLENVIDDNERLEALKYAETCGLDVDRITKTVVENIMNKPLELDDTSLQQKLTSSDEYKISAIDWLLLREHHRSEAIKQSNAMLFKFLIAGKLDAAQLLFNKIPSDSVDKILTEGATAPDVQQAVKEHLSYKSYLDGQEAFNLWFKHFKSKPSAPGAIAEDVHLSERVAHQHKMSQFKAENERWKLSLSHLAESAKTLLYNVLLFPEGGWLSGAENADYLRSTCVPECTLLLSTVLFESKLLNECVQLADILVSEKYGLYKVYNKQRLEEIVTKLTECSVALLEEKKDPWGNDTPL